MKAELFGNPLDQSVFGHGGVDLNGREAGPFGLIPKAIGEQPITH